MFTLRTKQEEKFYQEWKKNNDPNYCPFCNRDLVRKEFQWWILIENRFPYTTIADKHWLLACKRHIKTIWELTEQERAELQSILYQVNSRELDFDQISYNVPARQSIPFHFHLHLIKLKK